MISFTPNHQLRVNSTKSTIGNLQGAAGAVEAPATIKVSSSTSSTHIGDVSHE
jgi:3-oxoacyl-(acyl-carrier-protein) synthase